MNTKRTRERALIDEVERYLDAVELFRALGHEPCWRPETIRKAPAPPSRSPEVAIPRRAH